MRMADHHFLDSAHVLAHPRQRGTSITEVHGALWQGSVLMWAPA